MTTLAAGAQLGPYEIIGPLGAGGMGQVYRARDSRLSRQVAIKVSSEQFSERFEREARSVAALNHPHICTLFDVGPSYLVMELVEGETLAARLTQGPIALDEALRLGTQVAEALGAAHDKGIVHRDLKPGNVMVTPDGSVKVLDFGLAKSLGDDAYAQSGTGVSMHSPTLSLAQTAAGVILGTAAYMAPEQAKGRPVDKRADVWAFGVLLYEMLTGTRVFQGDDMSETLAAVIMKEPDFEPVPPQVRRLIKRCLEKDPRKRLRDMGSVLLLLEDGSAPELPSSVLSGIEAPVGAVGSPARRLPRWVWPAGIAVALAGMFAAGYGIRSATSSRVASTSAALVNLTLDLAPAEMMGPVNFYNRVSRTAFAISPDGTTVAYAGNVTKGDTRALMLYLRPLAEPQAKPVSGTEGGGEYPFFSPDGRWVGFSVRGEAGAYKLKKVSVSGGPPIDLCDIPEESWGAGWGPSGKVVVASSGLRLCSDSGGTPEVLLDVDPAAQWASPTMLPDGQHVLFTERIGPEWKNAHVDVIDITTRARKTLLTDAADARYSPTGHLVFMRNAALLAVPFDVAGMQVTGAPVPLLADVMQSVNAPNSNQETGMGQFALSGTGTLLYAPGGIYPIPSATLVRVDRTGAETAFAAIQGAPASLRVSRDGKRLIASKLREGSRASDIWQYELPSGTATRMTTSGIAIWPLWGPDGTSVMFTQNAPPRGLYALSAGNTPAPVLALQEGELGFVAAAWSPDGQWLAYVQTVNSVRQIFVRAMSNGKPGSSGPRQFSPSRYYQGAVAFSPDGKWLAYDSDESGALEVYVQPFPGPGEKRRVSKDGGRAPAWSPSGREIYYLKPSGAGVRTMMAADIATTGGSLQATGHRVLFEGPYIDSTPLRSYDVTPDGQFIMIRDEDHPPDQRVTRLNVVLGWGDELKRRVPSSTPTR